MTKRGMGFEGSRAQRLRRLTGESDRLPFIPSPARSLEEQAGLSIASGDVEGARDLVAKAYENLGADRPPTEKESPDAA